MKYIDLGINCASVLQPDGTLEYFAHFVMLEKLAQSGTLDTVQPILNYCS